MNALRRTTTALAAVAAAGTLVGLTGAQADAMVGCCHPHAAVSVATTHTKPPGGVRLALPTAHGKHVHTPTTPPPAEKIRFP